MRYRAILLTLLLLLFVSSIHSQASDLFRRDTIMKRMLLVAEWQLANPKHERYEWHDGAFYAGIFAAYETTHSPVLMKALLEMGEKNQWKPGPRFDHADDIAISQTYIDLYRLKKEKRMIQPTIDTVNRLKTEPGQQAE